VGRDEIEVREGDRVRFEVINCDQRTELWASARAGRATGSRAGCVLAKVKSGEAATRRDYRIQLALERLTGLPQESNFTSPYMKHGEERESPAIALYEAQSGNIVRRTGFLAMMEWQAGCSLDGDVDEFRGLVGVKCPKQATHLDYLKRRRLPPEYVPQVTHEFWVTGAEWYDFVSFDDRLPEWLQYFCVRLERSEFARELEAYEQELARFLKEVEAEVVALQKLKEAA
jgi:hypothetical protein